MSRFLCLARLISFYSHGLFLNDAGGQTTAPTARADVEPLVPKINHSKLKLTAIDPQIAEDLNRYTASSAKFIFAGPHSSNSEISLAKAQRR